MLHGRLALSSSMDPLLQQFVSSLPGWLSGHEGLLLHELARSQRAKSGVIVEIGSYCGKSTIYLALGDQQVYAIDPHKGKFSGGTSTPTYKQFINNIRHAGVAKFIRPIVKTSKAAAPSWKSAIKLLFIDGLHDEKHASQDYMLWSRHVTSGGIVAMHDAFCAWEGAEKVAYRQIVCGREYRSIGVVGSIVYGIKGTSSWWDRIDKFRMQQGIRCAGWVWRNSVIPRPLRFVIVHGCIRLFLVTPTALNVWIS